MNRDMLELLSPELLDRYPMTVSEIDYHCRYLWKEIGWHYILDISWILEQVNTLGLSKGATIVDVGAGMGVLQFLLADRGYNVISVDFSRRRIPFIPSLPFSIRRMGRERIFGHDYLKHLGEVGRLRNKTFGLWTKVSQTPFSLFSLLAVSSNRILGWRKPGWIRFYCADMKQMDLIETRSMDAIVSVSAVEHMRPADILDAVKEFNRVLKPGASMLITTSAAREKDWFHEPSKGWCFSEHSLNELFGVSPETSFDVAEYDRVMRLFQGSIELQRRLSSLYFRSGNNGMPWGKWNPTYLPVGIKKVGL